MQVVCNAGLTSWLGLCYRLNENLWFDIFSEYLRAIIKCYCNITIISCMLLFQYTKTDYVTLCEILEPIISVRAKEEIATTLVNILQRLGCVKEFLSDIVMAEVDKLGKDRSPDILQSPSHVSPIVSHTRMGITADSVKTGSGAKWNLCGRLSSSNKSISV